MILRPERRIILLALEEILSGDIEILRPAEDAGGADQVAAARLITRLDGDDPLVARLVEPRRGDAAVEADMLAKVEAVGHMGEIGLHLLLRSEERTSELQSLMRISYAVFCLN